MNAEIHKGTVYYHGADYKFKLADEQFHNHMSLIIRPQHIRILENTSKLDNKDLKAKIIETWFAQGNQRVRDYSNAKRRSKRAANG